MSYRTPFGRLDLGSPRFYRCRCQTKARQSFSPLANWLGDHTSPELQYLEGQFAARKNRHSHTRGRHAGA